MGCVARILYAVIIGLFAVTFGLALLIIGSAGTLGEAAIVSADDLVLLFFLNLASLVGLFFLMIFIWRGHRLRKRLESSIVELNNQLNSASLQPSLNVPTSQMAPQPSPTPQARFCGSCGAPVAPADTICANCGEVVRKVSASA